VIYLTAEDGIRFNERFIGPGGLMDRGMLDSAVGRPQMTFTGGDAYPAVHDKAAALFHSITRNHAFINGNKRTAVLAAGTFLKLNGYRLLLSDGEMIALATDTAEGDLDVPDIAKRLAENTERLPLADQRLDL
jgi:death-on-curing protein